MKKSILLFETILLLSVLSLSCSQKPENIKLSDLHAACEYLDAIEVCVDAAIELGRERDSKDLSDDERNYMRTLKKKAKEIEKAAEKKYTKAEVEECDTFSEVREKFKKVDKYW